VYYADLRGAALTLVDSAALIRVRIYPRSSMRNEMHAMHTYGCI
jgi:hypothetical protein